MKRSDAEDIEGSLKANPIFSKAIATQGGKMADEKKPKAKISKIFDENEKEDNSSDDWMKDYDGQLAVDAFQTEEAVIINAPIAGVKPDGLEVSITDETITIKGERKQTTEIRQEDYFAQECYWGSFTRSLSLPPGVKAQKSKASLKNGVLTITIPKEEKSKTQVLKIESE